MQTETLIYNLCSTCDDAADCRYTKSPENTIMFCDEFDGYKPEELKIEFARTERKTPEKNNPGKNNPGNLIGLCRNCELRDSCTYPKPEAGVWHCEEYL